MYQIAQRLGISESTVHGWRKGHEPRHSTGVAVLTIHTEICGAEATQNRCSGKNVYSTME